MEKKFFSRNKVRLVLVIAICVFFVALAFSGTAPKPQKTYYLNIPVAAFTPIRPEYVNYMNTGQFICFLAGSTIGIVCPVYLPQGAIVTELTTYYYDNDASHNFEGGSLLYKTDLYSNIIDFQTQNMGTVYFVTSGAINKVKSSNTTTIDYAIIDNQNNQYYILTSIVTDVDTNYDLNFYGCRITYTLPIGAL